MFSRRLPWGRAQNALALLEAERRAAGRTLLDLTVTNPTAVGIPYPVEEIARALADPAIARYAPAPLGHPQARAAVAAEYVRRGAAVDVDQVILTASSSESYALLFKTLADPGAAVLVPEPSYPLFDHLARLEGLQPRPYRLVFDGSWRVDFSTIDVHDARALCLVNPNNPTGSFVVEEDLRRLDALAAAHDMALVADEVFADYDHRAPVDAVRTVAGRSTAALTFALGGLSKAAGLPQMKLGWMVLGGPPALTEQARARLELVCDAYLSVGTGVQLAAPRLLSVGAGIRARITARVQDNLARLTALIPPDSPCTLLPCEGGWSAILRVPTVISDEEWALSLLAKDDVMVQPGYFFDMATGANLVLSLLVEPATFAEGVGRILDRVARGPDRDPGGSPATRPQGASALEVRAC